MSGRVCLSVCLFVCLSVCLSVCPSVCPKFLSQISKRGRCQPEKQTNKHQTKLGFRYAPISIVVVVLFLVAERLYVWLCLSVCLPVCLSVCLSVPNFCPRFLNEVDVVQCRTM